MTMFGGNDWQSVAQHVQTRDAGQVRSHANKSVPQLSVAELTHARGGRHFQKTRPDEGEEENEDGFSRDETKTAGETLMELSTSRPPSPSKSFVGALQPSTDHEDDGGDEDDGDERHQGMDASEPHNHQHHHLHLHHLSHLGLGLATAKLTERLVDNEEGHLEGQPS
jgi:hypothetical protein